MAPIVMWITAPTRAVTNTKWKSLPPIAAFIEAIIES
jgi:hypothetical protein